MRWPRRRVTEPGPQEPAAAPAAAPAEAGWVELPPLAGVLEPIQPTVSARSFQDGLAALTPPAPFLAPLGHEISPEAPAGLVAGLASPVAIPVQRRPAGDLSWVTPQAPRAPTRPKSWAPVDTAAEVPTAGSEPAYAPDPDVVHPAPHAPVLTSAPPVTLLQRSLRPVETAATSSGPAETRSLPLGSPKVVQRAATTDAPPERSAAAAPVSVQDAPVLSQDPLLPTGEPAPAEAGDTHASSEPVAIPTSSPPLVAAVPVPAVPVPTGGVGAVSGPSPAPPRVQRRLGLGAPLAERPPAQLPLGGAAPAPTAIDSPSLSPPPATAPLLGDRPEGSATPQPTSDVAPALPAASPSGPVASADLPLVVARRLPSPSLTGAGSAASGVAGVAGHPAAGGGGGIPAFTGLLPTRAPAPMIDPVPRRVDSLPPPAVKADLRTGEPAGLRPAPSLLSPAAPLAPRPTPPATASASEAVFTPTVEVAPLDRSVERAPLPTAVVQRIATLPAPALPLPSPAPPPAVMVQRAVDDALAAGSGSIASEPPPPPASTAPPTPPAMPALPAGMAEAGGGVAAMASSAVAAAGAALPTGDLDALAGRLYDKIRYRLKAELRLDRERAGLITDRR